MLTVSVCLDCLIILEDFELRLGVAFDDQTSTFIIPSGGGFEVTFCPSGRSSNILKVYKQQLAELSQAGSVSELLFEGF